eukprot:scaffold616_cov89-Phaeocystis_antarctica.AAC.2
MGGLRAAQPEGRTSSSLRGALAQGCEPAAPRKERSAARRDEQSARAGACRSLSSCAYRRYSLASRCTSSVVFACSPAVAPSESATGPAPTLPRVEQPLGSE